YASDDPRTEEDARLFGHAHCACGRSGRRGIADAGADRIAHGLPLRANEHQRTHQGTASRPFARMVERACGVEAAGRSEALVPSFQEGAMSHAEFQRRNFHNISALIDTMVESGFSPV